MNSRPSNLLIVMMCLSGFCLCDIAFCDEPKAPANERLRNDQEAISGRFARVERMLSQRADLLGHEDPEQAELLRRAMSQAREQAIAIELDAIARKLGESDYGAAREKQEAVAKSMLLLLKLLQSEDRRSSAEKERERLNGILKNVRNATAEQRAARSAAQNSNAPSNAAPAQQKTLKRTEGILEDIKDHDGQQSANENGEPGDGPETPPSDSGKSNPSSDETNKGAGPGDMKDAQKGKEKSLGEDPSLSEKDREKNGENGVPEGGEKSKTPVDSSPKGDPQGQRPPTGGQRSQGQPSESQSKSKPGSQSQGKPGSQSKEEDDTEQTPGRENIEQAKKMMQEALEQLQKQKRDGALDHQDAAIAELQKAAQELEEMLKQLREEEKEMILAALEARFQRLLAQQIQINERTSDLAATPREQWLDNAVSQCRDLSQQQGDVTRECSLTTGLLREDGTSVSILVAMEDVETDMGTVTERLRKTRVYTLTQSIQQDIKEALEELIKATQTEMEEMKSEERQQKQQQQADSQKKPPLVELMAEIRVLRSLQLRVNRRTKQVDAMLHEADQDDAEGLNDQKRELFERQLRLRESAGELTKRMEKQK